MLVTMSNGRGKIMVEFFSAEMEFNVCKNKHIETEAKEQYAKSAIFPRLPADHNTRY
jgi:hypothetical protein